MTRSARRRLSAACAVLAAPAIATLALTVPSASAAPAPHAPSPMLGHVASATTPMAASNLATGAGKQVPAGTPKRAADPAVAALAKHARISTTQAAARLTAQERSGRIADRLTVTLGARTGGAYFDANGKMVITVTDRAAAGTVVKAGVAVRVVPRSSAQLDAVKVKFDRANRVNPAVGTVTAVDVAANKVSVTLPTTAPAAQAARTLALARHFGDAVTVTRSKAKPTTLAWTAGGVAIYHIGGGRCSSGFNTKLNSYPTYRYVVTAGHCTALGGYWNNRDGGYLGYVAGSVFPGRDFGAIYNAGGANMLPGVYLYNGYYRVITYAANSYVGQYLCKSGSTTGISCGYVTAKNATVTYPQGTIYGTDRTNICAEPGDSGGSLFGGSGGYGLVSGGSGNCSSGGTTFFQPLPYVLASWNLSLI